jgi:hypothetical protein
VRMSCSSKGLDCEVSTPFDATMPDTAGTIQDVLV